MKVNYILKHKNVDAAVLRFETGSGTISQIKCINPKYVPYMRDMNIEEINLWWKYRAIPDSRTGIKEILNQYNCDSSLNLMIKNLALSLTDSFWICPLGTDIKWEMVNLQCKENSKISFKSITDEKYTHDPNATLNGTLKKYAEYNEKWQLIKYGDTEDGQQSINEAFANLIHQRQGFGNYVKYQVYKDDKGVASVCDFYTSISTELVSGYELLSSQNKRNDLSDFEHYIKVCSSLGIEEDEIRAFMDYQTLTDFIITNNDRHYRNFGLLRDSDSMNFIGIVPIFDNGNSMFYNINKLLSRTDILSIKTTGFYKKEEQLLKNVSDKKIVDIDKLPEAKEVMDFYTSYGISEEKAQKIALNYSHKIDFLNEFQHGKPVSLYHEKHANGENTPFYNDACKLIQELAKKDFEDEVEEITHHQEKQYNQDNDEYTDTVQGEDEIIQTFANKTQDTSGDTQDDDGVSWDE